MVLILNLLGTVAAEMSCEYLSSACGSWTAASLFEWNDVLQYRAKPPFHTTGPPGNSGEKPFLNNNTRSDEFL